MYPDLQSKLSLITQFSGSDLIGRYDCIDTLTDYAKKIKMVIVKWNGFSLLGSKQLETLKLENYRKGK